MKSSLTIVHKSDHNYASHGGNKRKVRLILVCSSIAILGFCSLIAYLKLKYTPYIPSSPTQIYLYGEQHGEKKLLEKEFELWKDYYDNHGMRYLFVENPYYTAEFLNLWMTREDDDILNQLYNAWEGSAAHTPYTLEFYHKVKQYCPETIFCGTDVGHQYSSIGEGYLNYLRQIGKEDSKEYQITLETIQQGITYYENEDEVYRENAMTENFIKMYDKLNGIPIMGIYGGAHTDPRKKNFTNEVDCMAKQLKSYYGDIIEYHEVSKS